MWLFSRTVLDKKVLLLGAITECETLLLPLEENCYFMKLLDSFGVKLDNSRIILRTLILKKNILLFRTCKVGPKI